MDLITRRLQIPVQTKPNQIKPKRKEKQFQGCDVKLKFKKRDTINLTEKIVKTWNYKILPFKIRFEI
jgi:hypothetical protein